MKKSVIFLSSLRVSAKKTPLRQPNDIVFYDHAKTDLCRLKERSSFEKLVKEQQLMKGSIIKWPLEKNASGVRTF